MVGGIADDHFDRERRPGDVVAKDVLELDRLGRRRDVIRVEPREDAVLVEDVVELAFESRQLVVGEAEPGEERDVLDVRAGQGRHRGDDIRGRFLPTRHAMHLEAPTTMPTIRPMAPGDLAATAAMIERGGWGDRRPFLRWALGHAEAEPLVGEVDGAIVASGVGTISGQVGWLGAIFVDAGRRREGFGRALTEALCHRLEAAGARTLALVASRMGAPLYESLGFREVTRYHTYEAVGTNAPIAARGLAVRPIDPLRDLAAITRLDSEATGEDRAHLIRAWARADAAIVVEDGGGTIHGFVVRPPFGGGATIADSAAAALALLEHRRRVVGPDRRVRAGVPTENEAGRSMLRDAGWEEAWAAPRMERGEPIPWHPERIFGQFGMAVG